MTSFEPSEHDLHAYLDGQLDPAQARLVEAWLARHPEAAVQVEGWRQDMQHLRAGLADLQGLPPNPALDPRAIRRARLARQRRQWATAAALLLALGLGGVGGWQAREQTLLADIPPMQDALEAHRLFALGSVAVDVQGDAGNLQAWLDRRFTHASRIPDLSPYGLRPVGGRLLTNEQGAAAILLFEDANGQRVSLYLRSPGVLYAEMPSGSRQDGDLEARYWSRNGYNYALVGPSGDPRGAVVQRALSL